MIIFDCAACCDLQEYSPQYSRRTLGRMTVEMNFSLRTLQSTCRNTLRVSKVLDFIHT